MTTTRGLGSTTSYNGGSARWEGLEDRGPRTVDVRDLPGESQAAHEILKTLKEGDPKGRARLLQAAQVKEPVTQRGLAAVAELFFRLEMPLTSTGIQRFKAERGLGGGTSVGGPVAKAYARAVEGGEVLFRVDRTEEQNLRPADKALLAFLRAWSRTPGVAEHVGRLKEALGLGNPDVGADAVALANEYIGASTVREVSKASSTKNCDLTPDGMMRLIGILEAERARLPAGSPAKSPMASPATQPGSSIGRMPAGSPTTTPSTLPPKFMQSLPAAMVATAKPGERAPRPAPAPQTSPQTAAPTPAANPSTNPPTNPPANSRAPAGSPQSAPPRMPASSPTTSPVTSTGLRRRPQ